MDPAIVADDPRYNTSLYVDPNCNFPANLLSEEDLTFVRNAVCEGDEGVIAALNSGLPMQPYVLDSLLAIRVCHKYSKVRLLLEPVITFTVAVAHYINARRILREATARRAQMFSSTDITRLDGGLRRLYRAIGSTENPYTLIEAVEDLDLPQGAYESHVKNIYDILSKLSFNFSTSELLDYKRLSIFNYIYESPKFTTQEAISTYADNLADITRRIQRPLRSLTVIKRSKEPHDVLNDILFSLSLGNAIVRHQEALRALRKSLLMKVNNLCAKFYVIYTQCPETKLMFSELARESFLLITSTSDEPPDFSRLICMMLRFVRAIISANIYANPDYITQQIFSLNSRLYNIEGSVVGHEDDLDIEIDHSGPYVTSYYITNPYTDSNLFRCPRDLVSYMGNLFVKKLTQDIITECTENNMTYDTYELDILNDLIIEGAAKHLKMKTEQLSQYLNTISTPSDVIDDMSESDIFADIEIRPPSSTRGPDRTPRFTNLKGAKPYSNRPQRPNVPETTV